MNRKTALCVLIVLSVAISMWIHIPLNIDREPTRDLADTTVMDIEYPTRNFWSASDGDLSSESITTFSETSADDTLLPLDTFYNDTIDLADGSTVFSGSTQNSYTDTHSVGGNAYIVGESLIAGGNVTLYFDAIDNVDGFSYAVYAKRSNLFTSAALSIELYNNSLSDYEVVHDLTTSYAWYNDTLYHPDWFNTSYVEFYFECAITELIHIDYVEITWYIVGGDYHEPFADVSDWSLSGTEDSESITSDGDVMSFTADFSGSNDWDYVASDVFTSVTQQSYFEMSYRVNSTAYDYLRVDFYASDDTPLGTYQLGGYATSTSWSTLRFYLDSELTTDEADIGRLKFGIRGDESSDDIILYVDYARIAPADNMGWGHDGSTTAGVSELTGRSGSISSDGNDLSLTADADGSVFAVSADTTSTAVSIDMNYYPFFDASFGSITWSNVQLGVWGTSNLFQGTYNFGDQSGNTGTDIDFVGSITNYDEAVEVVDEYMNHEYVFHAKDDATGSAHPHIVSVDFEAQTTGTIEAYFNSIKRDVYFMVRDDSNNNLVYVRDRDSLNRLEVTYDGGNVTHYYYDTDTFRHIKIEFDTDANTVSVWCNGNNIISDETTKEDTGPINNLRFYSGGYDSAEFYLDAVGITGIDGYNAGDNLAPVPTADTLADFRNIKAEYDEVYKYLIYVDSGDTVTAEWLKAYSIANWSFSMSSSISISDYVYVDSGTLVASKSTSNYMIMGLDPAVSISDTYNVWNLTMPADYDDAGEDWGFKQYVGGWGEWTKDETRGEMDSGTVTDIQFLIYDSVQLSAITFWTDTTDPVIDDIYVNPNDPHNNEEITFTVGATDWTSLQKLTINAVEYPSGFSDTDYEATETSATNLWKYTFSTLTEGYYLFSVTADDGQGTAVKYIPLTVRRESFTAYIRIFDTLGDFVPFETFEVYKNSSRIYADSFTAYTDEAYEIGVKDRWGETLNTTTFDANTEELVLTVNIWSLKVQSWHEDYVIFNLTRSGITYQEVIAPLEIVNFRLYENTYSWVVDYRNGTSVSGTTTLSSSDCIVVTGSTIADLAGYSTTLLEMTTEINVTVSATNNYVLEIQIDLENVNTTINEQLIQVLLNITNTNTTIYSQTVDLLAYLQNVNTTLYEQTAAFIIGVYNNHTTIYNQNVEILSTLSAIGSNVTANYISLSSTLSLIDSSLAANFTEIVADLTAISSDVTSNYISLSAQLSAIDSSLLANFTSISATLAMVDSSLLSNFTVVMSTLTAVGSNVTANYLSLSATLSAIDSSLLSNFTSISATLSLLDSSLLSNFTEITSELYAVNSSIGSQFLSVSATLNMIDSSLLANFTSVSATLSLMDSNLLSNFTTLTAELYAVNSTIASEFLSVTAVLNMLDSNLLSNFTTLTAELYSVNSSIGSQFLSVSATLSLIDSNLLSNFTEVVATLSAIDSNITANYLSLAATLNAIDSSLLSNFTSISATLGLIDSNLLSNFTTIVANLTAIDSNITANHLIVSALLTAMQSNITTNHLTIIALLNAVDSSISASEINIVAAISEIPVFRGVTTSELINVISASIGVEWLDLDGDGRPDTVSQPLKDQLPKPQEDLPFWLISIVILLVILAVLIRLGRNLAPTVYRMIKNSRSLNVQLANSKSK